MVSRVIPFLFLTLVVLQLLDMHSTLIASAERIERNKLITWLANNLGIKLAVVTIKMLDLIVIGLFFSIWKRSNGVFNGQFFLCLTLIALVYLAVVMSNYSV